MTSHSPEGGPLHVVHHHPGRLRVRALPFEGREDHVAPVRRALLELAGVSEVRHSPETGSLVIVYEPIRTDPNVILAIIEEIAHLDEVLDEVDGAPPSAHLRNQVFSGANALDDFVLSVSRGRADLRAVVAGALFASSVYVLVKNPKDKRIPRWDNLLWWSFSVLSGDVVQTKQVPESP